MPGEYPPHHAADLVEAQTAAQAELAEAPIFDDAYLLDTTGLGPAELDQKVKFMSYDGTVREMLSGPKCTVRDIYQQAYAKGGPEAVATESEKLASWDPQFVIVTSDETKAFHEGKITRDELLATAAPQSMQLEPEQPDFLAH